MCIRDSDYIAFTPGINPRPTLKPSFFGACSARTLHARGFSAACKARPLQDQAAVDSVRPVLDRLFLTQHKTIDTVCPRVRLFLRKSSGGVEKNMRLFCTLFNFGQRLRTTWLLPGLTALVLSSSVHGQTMKAPDITRDPTLYVVPYAHLDTQWRWEMPQTISEYPVSYTHLGLSFTSLNVRSIEIGRAHV